MTGRVLVLATDPDGVGGIAHSLPTLIAELEELGELAGLRITHRSRPRQRLLPAVNALASLPGDLARIRRGGVRPIVFAQVGGPVCLARTAPLIALARQMGAVVWVQLHSAGLDPWLRGARRHALAYALRPAHCVFAGTGHYATRYRIAGLTPVRVMAPALPADVLDALDRQPPPRKASRTLRLLCASRLVTGKGLDLVVDAVRNTDDHLTVAGEGPLRAELEQRARPFSSRVHFTGWVSPLTSLFDQADAFVLPSRSDTYGLAVAEALAHGMPTLVADSPVLREVHGDVVLSCAATPSAVRDALDLVRSGNVPSPEDARAHVRGLHRTWQETLRRHLASG